MASEEELEQELTVLRCLVSRLVPSQSRIAPADELGDRAKDRLTASGCTHTVSGDYIDATAEEVKAVYLAWLASGQIRVSGEVLDG